MDLLCPLMDYLVNRLGSRRVQWIHSSQAVLVCPEGLAAVTVSAEVPPPPSVDTVLLPLDPIAAGETLVALREAGWHVMLFTVPSGETPDDILPLAISYQPEFVIVMAVTISSRTQEEAERAGTNWPDWRRAWPRNWAPRSRR